MPDEKKLYQNCPACYGTGEIYENADSGPHGAPPELFPEPCTHCGATGQVSFGEFDDDLITFLQDLETKIDDLRTVVDDIKTVVDAL